jgi:DNA-damage-inducible protein J
MATTNFNLRLEQDLRDKAFPVFERYGLSASQALNYF